MKYEINQKVVVSRLPRRMSIPFFQKYEGRTGTIKHYRNPYYVVSFGPSQADDMAFTEAELDSVPEVH